MNILIYFWVGIIKVQEYVILQNVHSIVARESGCIMDFDILMCPGKYRHTVISKSIIQPDSWDRSIVPCDLGIKNTDNWYPIKFIVHPNLSRHLKLTVSN